MGKTYKTREDISTHKELLESIIAFSEIFYCIFYNIASNPIIEITIYNTSEDKEEAFIIDNKYIRSKYVSMNIEKEYNRLLKENEFMQDFENIRNVQITVKGTRRGKQMIYHR